MNFNSLKYPAIALAFMASSLMMDAGSPWHIANDTLWVFDGSTYAYTVDTPEDKGLTSTLADAEGLLKSLSEAGVAPRIIDLKGATKLNGKLMQGDRVVLSGKKYPVAISRKALPAEMSLRNPKITKGVSQNVILDFYAGQRTPMSEVDIIVPAGIKVTPDNVWVNVIGRGEVQLRNLSKQSVGRHGTDYSYDKVGEATMSDLGARGTRIHLSGLDFRPENGSDITLMIKGCVAPEAKDYVFEASYTTSEPLRLVSPKCQTTLKAVNTITDFRRLPRCKGSYDGVVDYSWVSFGWTPSGDYSDTEVLYSTDEGTTWQKLPANMMSSDANGQLNVSRLDPDRLYAFRLNMLKGNTRGVSNTVWYYTGEFNAKDYGVKGDGTTDETDAINALIAKANEIGGGVIYFPEGTYNVRTVHLKSNVWLHIGDKAVIAAIPGGDEPETTWFSDRAYRHGLSPVDIKPYSDPENYLTKQDVGHTFFRNCMFFGERIENVKIIGTGRITGNGNLFTSDRVMNNERGLRCDKMFVFKLCKDIEIGGVANGQDLWYDEEKDVPYYITPEGRDYNDGTMLQIDQAGHFVLLATGSDGLNMHDTYFGKDSRSNARDIYDFMSCNDVNVRNIYSTVSSDDIVKLGSDCSLGYTRPACNYLVRNVIGDTNCNLFQIGSETADDITDVYVDNIFVLGANKAGFSISTNDGGCVRNVHLNSGKTGPIFTRSVMKRTRSPFFISISNRGRVLGANAEMFTFRENGSERKELLVTNSNIGKIENVTVSGVDVSEVYGGSSFRGERWKGYDGSQNEAAAIIAGFKLPDSKDIEGGLTFTLPDGLHTGYIKDISFSDVNLTVKGGHSEEDATACPPEIGVGRYNVSDLKVQPAFGYWLRHVDGATFKNCHVNAEKPDARHAIYLDDVLNFNHENLTVGRGINEKVAVMTERCDEKKAIMAWGSNSPIGKARGIHPGRVAWAHAPGAATWNKDEGRWYEDDYNDQEAADWLVHNAIITLTGEKNAAKAWNALFSYFNKQHGKGGKGYRKGEKIAVKLNLNNTFVYEDNEQLNASPHVVLALLRSMVNEGGIPQECITLFDASRFMTNALYNKCHAEFPDVVYMDNEGGEGRTKATYARDAIPYSMDNGKLAKGLATCAVDADYLINMALLKGHGGQGVTLCAKNWYGVTDIDRNFRKNQHNNFNQDRSGRPRFMTFTDFMGHKDLGEKTMLFLIDGLYGSKDVNGAPSGKWQMTPFKGDWPCSLFASQDGVAIDAVGIDFLTSEFPTMPDVDYCDMYLVEAALADSPLSKTFYDPERDGTGLKSLGVLEHWNNSRDKQYTRNLGTDAGIELIYVKKP